MAVGPGPWRPERAYDGVRAASADRERVADLLKDGYAEGRLSKEEYDLRIGRALTARTTSDLTVLVADLPAGAAAVHGVVASGPRPTSPLAIASMACGVGQFAFGPLTGIPAIVLGHMAHKQIRQTGDAGSALATIGIVLGWTGVILVAAAVVAVLLIVRALQGG